MLKMTANGGHDFDLLCPTVLNVCYFSLFLHLRYRELVTSKRVITALVSIWIASGAAAIPFVAVENRNAILIVIGEFVGLLLTTLAFINIYRVVRYHQNQIQSQLQQQNAQAIELLREKKSAFNAVYFCVIFVACYLPNFCSSILLMPDIAQTSFWFAFHVTLFFVLLNSSLNPLVFCWRYQEIRHNVRRTVKKFFCITETYDGIMPC